MDAATGAALGPSRKSRLKTQAFLELPILIATKVLQSRYDQGLAVLEQHADRLMLPVDHFLWHVAYALILAAKGERARAATHARSALQAASRDNSGFRYHPTVGLVTEEHDGLLRELAALGAA